MNRRPFLRTIATGGALLASGCVDSLPVVGDDPDPSDVFESYRYEGTDLVVEFRDGADVETAVLFNSATDEEYDRIENPSDTVRFPVVFPDRLESHLSRSLRVKAETSKGWAERWVWEPVHGAVRNIEVLSDGRARFDLENQGDGPLLVRFVGIYGDVPHPTVDPQDDSFDRSTFDLGPGVVGVGGNRPLSASRTDLVVRGGETEPFETTYAPFAFPDGARSDACDGAERTGTIAIVHASGGSAAYSFTYALDGEPAAAEGHVMKGGERTTPETPEVCKDPRTDD